MENKHHAQQADQNKHNSDHTNGEHGNNSGHEQLFRRRFWICLVFSIPVLIYSSTIQGWLGFTAPVFPGSQWITPFFSTVVFLVGGIPFIKMAIPELRKRQPGMMTLISLAIVVSFGYSLAVIFLLEGSGFFWELVTLIDVMLLGHWIEMRSVRQASRSLDELASLMPDDAVRLTEDGEMETVLVRDLQEGDLVLVRPGASIPADGIIEQGGSQINESMITGESKPVNKTPGDEVIAGTINGDSSLRVRIRATGEDTALSGIMRLVEEAQESKSNTQLLADRAAGWLFYFALVGAVITAIGWTIGQGFDVEVIKRVATVLVIACPHALGLAIPLVVAITTSIAATNGVLVRDRLDLEKARQIDVVIFDKTGTLTQGEFGVVSMSIIEGWSEEKALKIAAAIESDSEHMIAQGIRRSAKERSLSIPDADDFEALKGRGVRARLNGELFYVGSPYLIETLELDLPQSLGDFSTQANQKGQTVVYLAREDQAIAAYALADQVRSQSKAAVDRLHHLGLEVAMLTGDSQAVAAAVAAELDIDQYFAEVLPQHKDQKIKKLQDQGKLVAMVGDGVNDAPALTRADVGIAIGSGTDVAVESAGIVLVKSNPMDVVKIIELSQASYRKMLQNLFWAAGYNVIALPLAAGILAPFGVLISPAMGALLMSLSTVIVAINAQFLRRIEFAAG